MNCVVANNWTYPVFNNSGGGGKNCSIFGELHEHWKFIVARWGVPTKGICHATTGIDYYNTSYDPSSTNYYQGFNVLLLRDATPVGFWQFLRIAPACWRAFPVSPRIRPVAAQLRPPPQQVLTLTATRGPIRHRSRCDEPYPGNVTGTNLGASISAAFTNYPPEFVVNFQANISGPAYASVWNFGDGTLVTNMPSISHTWPALGTYPVTLTAYNDTYPTGVTANLTINISTSPGLLCQSQQPLSGPAPPYLELSCHEYPPCGQLC